MTAVNGDGVIACVGEPLVCFASTPRSSLVDSGCAEVSEGGAEFNVAVHLARLGNAVRFVSAIGDDVLGRRIEARLHREGIDTTTLRRQPGERTGAYVKDWTPSGRNVVYLRQGSAASRLAELPAQALRDVTHLHVSGITASLSDACRGLVDRLLSGPRGYTVSFDVNYREKLWPAAEAAPVLQRLASAADLVLVGRDEAEQLWGTATADDVRRLLPRPAELVVKDDDREAVAWSGTSRVALAPTPVEVTEPIGAGDAFAAGYLHARLHGHAPRPAIAVGHRMAQAALQAADDLGAPVPVEELDRLLKETG
ncbi:MAG TPA: sugar kinase [Pseudonocardiaceae bacterium]|jgi:2-dehydro-3-deoxygluconokinase